MSKSKIKKTLLWFGLLLAAAPANAAPGPVNDNFAQRIVTNGAVLMIHASNANATKEALEPSHGGVGGKSVWWSWQASISAPTTITTAGSTFDTLLAVYTGTSLSALNPIASNDDENQAEGIFTSRVTFQAVAGTVYQIAVDGAGGAEGQITLNLAENAPPTVNLSSPANGSRFGAKTNITICADAADAGGAVSLVEFFDGEALLGSAASNPYCLSWTNAPVGNHTLTARVTDNTGLTATSSPVTIKVELKNDNFADRIPIPATNNTTVTVFGSNAGATKESGEPDHLNLGGYSTPGGASVWWSWRAPAAGRATLVPALIPPGRPADDPFYLQITLVGVYLGSSVAALTPVPDLSFADGKVLFDAVAGNVYQIAVDGLQDGSGAVYEGDISLSITISQPPTVSLTAPADGAVLRVGTNVLLQAVAADSDGLISRVDFYENGQLLGSDSTKPYSITWSNAAEGAHYLTAVAVDNTGTTTTTDPANISILALPGDKLWELSLGGPGLSIAPAIGSDGTIYVGSEDTKLYAINPDSTKKWEFATGSPIDSSPSIGPDGTIYIGAGRTLYAVQDNGDTPTKKWEVPTGHFITSTAGIGADGTVYLTSWDGNLYAINPANGQTNWMFNAGGRITLSPAIAADGTIYIGSYDTNLFYAVRPDGTKRWEFVLGADANTGTSPSIGADGTIYVANGNGIFYALNPDGTKKWEVEGARGTSAAIGADGTIYYSIGSLGAFNPVDGSPKTNWTAGGIGFIRACPALGADGTVYISSAIEERTNTLTLFALKSDGTVQWKFETGVTTSGSYSPTIGFDGTVYLPADNGKLYAIKGTAPLAVAPWPKFQRNLKQTGNAAILPGDKLWEFTVGFGPAIASAIGADGTVYTAAAGKLLALSPTGAEQWEFPVDASSSPAIGADGTIFVGSNDGKLVAIDPSGTNRWEFSAGGPVTSTPALAGDGTVYFGCRDNKLYALDARGVKRWEFLTGGAIESSPAVGPDGTIYFGSLDHKFYAVAPDGTKRWDFTLPEEIWSSPAMGADGTVYVGCNNNVLYAFDPNGHKKWELAQAGGPGSPAIASDGTIYMGSVYDGLNAIKPDGSRLWTALDGNYIRSTPAVAADGTVYVGSDSGQLYALHADGRKSWELILRPNDELRDRSPAIGFDGTIYMRSGQGDKLYALKGTAPLAHSPWPKFHRNAAQTGNAAVVPGDILWAFATGNQVLASPAIGADGTIYIGSADYLLYALRPDGTRKWDFATGGVILSSAAIGRDGTIYVGSEDHKLYAIRDDGTLPVKKWEFLTGDAILGSPAIGEDGTIYTPSLDGKLYALNPDGTKKWEFDTGASINSSPAVGADGTIYVGPNTKKMIALRDNGTSASRLWEFATTQEIWTSSPALGADGTIYFGGFGTRLYALRADGTEKWEFQTDYVTYTSPAVGPDGTVYFGSEDGRVYALQDKGTNALKQWAVSAGRLAYSSPALAADGTVYIGGDDGVLSAVDAAGRIRWKLGIGSAIFSSPAIAPDGTVYFGGSTGDYHIYAVKGSAGLASGPWPMFRRDLRHTGRAQTTVTNNDNFAASATLSGASANVFGSNLRASAEAGEPSHANKPGGKSVWWSWRAPASGIVTLSTKGSSFDTLLAVYTGASLASLVPVASDDDSGGDSTSQVSFLAATGTTYQIAVDGFGGSSGNITLNLLLNAPPAINITSPATGARFTAPANLDISASAVDPDGIISQVDFYAGTTLLGAATSAPYSVHWSDIAPGSYVVTARATDNSGATATSLPVTIEVTPSNDNFANAALLSGVVVMTNGSNVNASEEPGEPSHPGKSGGRSVWWSWTAPFSGIATLSTIGSSFDTLLDVYTGGSLTNLILVAEDDDSGGNSTSQLTLPVLANTIYQISVDGFAGSAGNIQLNLVLVVPPTVSLSSPAAGAIFTAPTNVPLAAKAVDQDGSVRRVDFFQNRTFIGSVINALNNNYSLLWTNVAAGQYELSAIAIDNLGNRGTSAPVAIRVQGTVVAPRFIAQPQNQTVIAGESASFSVTVDGTPPLGYQWRFFGTNLAGATNPVLVVANSQPANAGAYSVVVSNSAAVITSQSALLSVLAPPKITSLSLSQEVAPGANLTLSVVASGTGPLSYQWRLNGLDIARATNALLLLSNLQPGDSGNYSVKVSNAAGARTSADILITVTSGSSGNEIPSIPRDDFWITDGPVYALVETNGIIYLGGDFNYVGPNIGGGAALDIASGLPDQAFPRVNGEVDAVAADGAGGWFIGGNFISVGGLTRQNIAHVRTDKTVDPVWTPAVSGPVRALVLSGDLLYLGGQFTNVSDQPRLNLAALDATTGELAGWQPAADGAVLALAVVGSNVYVGGVFSTINDRTRKRIAAIGLADGLPTAWNPNLFGTAVSALALGENKVYVGGQFYNVGGQPRNNLASLSADTGAATDWNPDADNQVRTLAVSGARIYAGGFFTRIGDDPRNYIAAIDAATGRALAWDPDAANAVLTISPSGSTVYVGGQFSSIGGAARNRLAALDAASATATAWDPNPNDKVFALAVAGSYVYAGGQFLSAGGVVRNYLAALDAANGSATEWNPDANLTVHALALSGNILYAGGEFTGVGGESRNRLAALDASSAEVLPWNPDANGPVYALAALDSSVYAGGAFTVVHGQTKNRLTALDADSGLPTVWNPDANDTVLALALDSGTLYAGGQFTAVGAVTRNGVAAWNPLTGQLTAWNPNANGSVKVLAISAGTIYAGGSFANIGGQPRNRLAALDAVGDATSWDPNVSDSNNSRGGSVGAIVRRGNQVYAGGLYNQIGGQGRNHLATIDAATGRAGVWNPNPDGEVLSLSAPANAVYAGGWFSAVGGQLRPFFAAFAQPGAPGIIAQPVNETVALSGKAAFTVVARGRDPLFYQWKFNGADLPGQTNATLEISNSQPNHSGLYSVTVSNALGAITSAPAALQVLAPPSIVGQPLSQTVAPGANVILTVAASGSGPLIYQWRLNGANLPGETNQTLTLSNVQATNSGSYSVAVANAVGAENSSEAILTVVISSPLRLTDNFQARNLVTNQPSGTVSGNNAGATAEVGEPRHAGKRGGKSVWLSWKAPAAGIATFNTIGSSFDTLLAVYSGASLASLNPVISDEDSGGFFASSVSFNALAGVEYQIAVDGFAGATGNVVLNWKLEPTLDEEVPRIIQAPQSQTKAEGSKVTLTVEAQSSKPLTYDWFLNGQHLPATGPSLVIPSLQQNNVGIYTVTVSNDRRSVSGLKAVVEIGPDAQAISEDKLQDLLPGEDSGTALTAASLRRRDNFAAPVAGLPGTQVLDNFGASKEKGEPNHGGNTGGASRLFKLKIESDGTLIVDTIGSDIDTVMAVYTGTSWDDIKLIASDDNSAPDHLRSLVRLPVVRGDEYLVAADGVNGATGNIKLNWKLGTQPRITQAPISRAVRAGDGLTLSADAAGSPKPSFQWRFKGIDLPGATNATLTLNNVQPVNAGNYSVIARNYIGSASSSNALLTILSPVAFDPLPVAVNGVLHWQLRGKASEKLLVVQGSTNLLQWEPVFTNNLSTGVFEFVDPNAGKYSRRFYRAQ